MTKKVTEKNIKPMPCLALYSRFTSIKARENEHLVLNVLTKAVATFANTSIT